LGFKRGFCPILLGGVKMKRKYPTSMFIMGIVIELFKMRIVLLIAIILLLAQFFIEQIPALIPLLVFAICIIVAILKQMKQRNAILTMNPNDEANDLINKMFADNNRGYRNIIDAVDEIIEQNNSDE